MASKERVKPTFAYHTILTSSFLYSYVKKKMPFFPDVSF